MQKSKLKTIVILLALGLLLALVKGVYLFLDFNIVLDVVVFFIAGFTIGGKIARNRPILGLSLAIPAFILCLFFVLRLGYSSIVQGVGTSFAVSLIVIPLATYIGVFLRSKRAERRSV
jgi:hypothetical protein